MADRILPDFEGLVEMCTRHVLRPGDGAIDVGAHLGRHVRVMLEVVGPTGHVLAIEPLPDCATRLEADLGGHPGLSVVVGAVALQRETLDFMVAVDRPEESSLRARSNYTGPTDLRSVPVEAHPLDDLAAGMARVDFVKVDVEGAEALVLESGRRTFQGHRPALVFEHGHGISDFGGTSAQLYELVEDLGLLLFGIDGGSIRSAAAMDETTHEGRFWDFLALPPDHPAVGTLPDALAVELPRGIAIDETITEAYQTVLGRMPDTVGLETFRAVCRREGGAESMMATLRASAEARARTGGG